MKQYERGAAAHDIKSKSPVDLDSQVAQLRRQVARHDATIERLQRDIRQLKSRLDQHADRLNRKPSG